MLALLFSLSLVIQTPPADPQAAAEMDFCALDGTALETLRGWVQTAPAADSEEDQVTRMLTRAGADVALAERDVRACRRVFERGARDADRALEEAERRMRSASGYPVSPDAEIAEVQSQLTALWLADQAGRQAYLATRTQATSGADFWAHRLVTARVVLRDARSTEYLLGLLERWDWIDADRFGARIASRAWIIAQHADDHPDFQQVVLDRMTPYLETEGVRRADYAHLWDRVAVNTGRPQRYGTQSAPGCSAPDGGIVLRPLEDEANLAALRADMGLPPLGDYATPANGGGC